jgi:cholestenol delta-isomerase
MTDTMISDTPHPFYPLGIEVAGYLANDKDTVTLLGIALAGLVVICSATWAVVSNVSHRLRTADKLAILWFMSSRALLPQKDSILC